MEKEVTPSQLSDKDLHARLWAAGLTRFVLKAEQREMWDLIDSLPEAVKRACFHWSRRFGKSTSVQTIADSRCRRFAYHNVIHAFPTKDNAVKVTRDNAVRIYKTCPKQLQPTWRSQGGFFEYPWNGSRYYVRGLESETDVENALGLGADLIIFDEAGFIRHLKYAIQSFAPMLLGRKDALMLLISSSARDPFHDFYVQCDRAQKDGAFSVKKIWETSLYSKRELDDMAADCGGTDSVEWRANYECERIVDAEFAVLPEWPQCKDNVIAEVPRPKYFNTCIGLDLGWHPDFTFGVLGHYDFENGLSVIEGEFEISQMTTDMLANELTRVEQELWSDYWEEIRRYHPPQVLTRNGSVVENRGPVTHTRWQDVDKQIQADLTRLHNLPINQANNRNPQAQVNRVRLAMKEGRLKIHPRCKRLIAHCSAAQWNKMRNSFERIDGFGHFDGVSALCIFVSHIDQTSNPFPEVPIEAKTQEVVDLRPYLRQQRLTYAFRRR